MTDDRQELDRWLSVQIEREHAHERQVRRVALGAWAAVAGLVPVLAIAIFMIRVVSDGWTRDATRVVVVTSGIFAILATVLALVTTVAWLYRPRTASLAILDRRLAALEQLLRADR